MVQAWRPRPICVQLDGRSSLIETLHTGSAQHVKEAVEKGAGIP